MTSIAIAHDAGPFAALSAVDTHIKRFAYLAASVICKHAGLKCQDTKCNEQFCNAFCQWQTVHARMPRPKKACVADSAFGLLSHVCMYIIWQGT